MRKFRGTYLQLRGYLLELIAEITKFVTSPPKPTSPSAVSLLRRKSASLLDIKKAVSDGRVVFSDSLPEHCYEDCFFPSKPLPCPPSGGTADNTIPIDGSVVIKDPLYYVNEIEFTDDRHIIDGEYLDDIVAYHENVFLSLTTIVADATVFLPAKPQFEDLNAYPAPIEAGGDWEFPTEVGILVVSTGRYDISIGGGGGSGCAIVCKDIHNQQIQVSGGRAGELNSVSMELVKGDFIMISYGIGGTAVSAVYDNTEANPNDNVVTAGEAGGTTELWILDINGVEKTNSRITALGGAGGLASGGTKLCREVDINVGFNSGCASIYDITCAMENSVEDIGLITYLVAHNSENSQFEVGRQCRYLYTSTGETLIKITGEFKWYRDASGTQKISYYSKADDSCGGSAVLVGIETLGDDGVYKAISGHGGQGFCKIWRNGYD